MTILQTVKYMSSGLPGLTPETGVVNMSNTVMLLSAKALFRRHSPAQQKIAPGFDIFGHF